MLLAIDTSTRQVGVAIYDGTTVLAESIWLSQDFHTTELAPAVQNILQRAGIQITQLKALGVANGPGSFTGLRIGLALAKGISLACHIPLYGIPSLDILAYAQPVLELPMAAVIAAGRQRLAVGWYHADDNRWNSSGSIEVLNAQSLADRIQQPTFVCGELSESDRRIIGRRYRNARLASPARSVRRPSFLAELAWKRWLTGKPDDPATLSPLYLNIGEPIPG